MGLDQYLYAERQLTTNRKRDRELIRYLNSLDMPDDKFDVNNDGGWYYVSSYLEFDKPIRAHLDTVKLHGQLGHINEIRRHDDWSWSVKSEAMYWRKDNHIHQWFVDHVQAGVDDCGEYEVNELQFDELLVTIKDILSQKGKGAKQSLAEKLLPTSSGFFFGATDYDKYYYEALRYTRDGIKKVLGKSRNEWKFSYHSSW